MDTRYWGPSGWQLFHLIAREQNAEKTLQLLPTILPCKFCRASSAEFVAELPIQPEYPRWIYDIHNKVNHKLRTQCANDPKVINPGLNPSFESVRQKYDAMKPTDVPGRDFLFAIARNYSPEHRDIHEEFLRELAECYPFEELRKEYNRYLSTHIPALGSRSAYMSWMYGLVSTLSKVAGSELPSRSEIRQHVGMFVSGCSKKTFKGKTCRGRHSTRFTTVKRNLLGN